MFFSFVHGQEVEKYTPEQLVQQQVEAYNKGDIDAFLEPYSDDFEVYNFPNTFLGKGKESAKQTYESMFEKYPDLHCEIRKRMVLGNKVIDHEKITGVGPNPFEAIAIYEIEDNKIKKLTFVR